MGDAERVGDVCLFALNPQGCGSMPGFDQHHRHAERCKFAMQPGGHRAGLMTNP